MRISGTDVASEEMGMEPCTFLPMGPETVGPYMESWARGVRET